MKLKTLAVLILFTSVISVSGQSEQINEVTISATMRTYVLSAPRYNAELERIFEAGAEESAFGHDGGGNWLRIMDGWVLAEVFNTEGEIWKLPDTGDSFVSTASSDTRLYGGPSTRWYDSADAVAEGARVLIIGRNEDSTWLHSPGGWVDAAIVSGDGDTSLLPVTPSGVIITAKTRTFILEEPDLSAEFVDVFE